MSDTQAISGGFDDAVLGAQAGFHLIMNAMARPGTVETVEQAISAPPPLNTASAVAALTLCDADTPVYLDPKHQTAAQWLRFQTDAPVVGDMSEAAFVFLTDGWPDLTLPDLTLGSQEYPDRSATLIAQVDGFVQSPAWELTGPGIRKSTDFQPVGLPDGFNSFWQENGTLFPRGVDVIFTAGARLAALPRTTRLGVKQEA